MKRLRFGWLLSILRYGLCVVAIAYLATVIRWSDRVRLAETGETWHRVVETRADGLVIERDGRQAVVAREQIRRVDVGGRQVEELEKGIVSVVRGANTRQALAAILIFLPAVLLQCGRLVVMLAVQGVRLSIWTCTKLTFAGNFFNFALPGTTGGDLIKAYYITRHTHLKTEAVTTVFLDRAIGLLGLVLLAGGAILLTQDVTKYRELMVSLGLLCAALAAGAVLVFSRRVREMLRLREIVAALPLGEQLLRVGRATVAMRTRKGLVLLALAMTIVLQAVVMLSASVMAWALGMHGQLAHFFIFCSIGFLIAAIPISPPQAIGVMEAAYVQFFTQPGLDNDPSQAVALALAARLIQLVWALPGILVPLLGAHVPSQAEIDALEQVDDQAAPTATRSAPRPSASAIALEPAPVSTAAK